MIGSGTEERSIQHPIVADIDQRKRRLFTLGDAERVARLKRYSGVRMILCGVHSMARSVAKFSWMAVYAGLLFRPGSTACARNVGS